jgi:hypothetical protein
VVFGERSPVPADLAVPADSERDMLYDHSTLWVRLGAYKVGGVATGFEYAALTNLLGELHGAVKTIATNVTLGLGYDLQLP